MTTKYRIVPRASRFPSQLYYSATFTRPRRDICAVVASQISKVDIQPLVAGISPPHDQHPEMMNHLGC